MSNVYRCEWCGRFYSSYLPEGSACPDHIHEHNARLTADIAGFNARLAFNREAREAPAESPTSRPEREP